jgi:phage recombination protein Bet
MSTAVVQQEFSYDQIDLLKRTICKGSTDDEFKLFLSQCKRTGLDPFAKQIYAVKRWNGKEKREEMSIQIGVDGLRLIANRSGECDGQEGPYWCGDDGKWQDVWLHHEPPQAAKVVVYRKGQAHPYVGIARWASYVQTTRSGEVTHFWAKMPDQMLAKVAETIALRKAFPQELSGLYSTEEMPEADTIPVTHHAAPVPQLPAPAAPQAEPEPYQHDYAPPADDGEIVTKGQLVHITQLLKRLQQEKGERYGPDQLNEDFGRASLKDLTRFQAWYLVDGLLAKLSVPEGQEQQEQEVPV